MVPELKPAGQASFLKRQYCPDGQELGMLTLYEKTVFIQKFTVMLDIENFPVKVQGGTKVGGRQYHPLSSVSCVRYHVL